MGKRYTLTAQESAKFFAQYNGCNGLVRSGINQDKVHIDTLMARLRPKFSFTVLKTVITAGPRQATIQLLLPKSSGSFSKLILAQPVVRIKVV